MIRPQEINEDGLPVLNWDTNEDGLPILPPVTKKKGAALAGSLGASLIGTEDISTQPLPLGSVAAIAGKIGEDVESDPFYGIRKGATRSTPEGAKPLILIPIEPEIAVSINTARGPQKFVITPSKVPEGYEKTVEGAQKYAQDISTSLLGSSLSKDEQDFNDTLKDVAKTSILGKLENNDATVSVSDLGEINKLLGTNVTSISDNILDLLKQKKRQLKTERSALYPEKPVDIATSNKQLADIDKYVKKVGNSLQDEQSVESSINVLGADTRSDLQATFSGVESTIKDYSNRMGTEKLSNSFVTGMESLKYKNKNEYEILKNRIESGKTLSSVKVAELTNTGSKIIDARNLEKLETGEIDIDQYNEKSNEIIKTLEDNFYKRPDILQRQIAGVIAKHYQEEGTAFFGQWFVSDDKIDAVPESAFVEAGIDINRPESKAAINNIKANEGVLPFDNAIQKDSFVRELGRGFVQPIKGVTDALENIGSSDNELRLQKELEPVTNYTKQRSDYFNKRYGGIADAFNGAGQFISQYLMMEAGVGAFRGIGLAAGGAEASLISKVPESATPTAVREGTKVGNYIIDKSQLWGQLAVPFIQTYDNYYKDALSKTGNPIAAKVASFVNASMEALSEQIFSNVKFGRQVISNFRSSGLSLDKLAKVFDRGVFDEVAEKELRQTIQQGVKQSIKAVAEGSTGLIKESFEEVPVQFTNFVADAMLNPQNVENRELLPELKDAFLAGMVSFSIPSILGVAGRIKTQFNNSGTQQDALMIAATNRNDVLDAIYSQVEDGELNTQQANEKIKILNTAAVSLKEIPKSYVSGEQMSEADKVKYLSLDVQEKVLKDQNATIGDDAVKSINEEKIQQINDQKRGILKIPESKQSDEQQFQEKPVTETEKKAAQNQDEINIRSEQEIKNLLNPVDESGKKIVDEEGNIVLTTSKLRLPRDVADPVTGKDKMSIKDLKTRAATLRELVNCLT